MPTYVYECQKCKCRRDEWKALAKREDPVSPCDLCQNQMIRIVAAPGIALRGQGWHNTDYSKTGPKERRR